MKRYEVTGIPLGAPFSALTDRRIGDQFDADLDPDIERILLGAGALIVIGESEPEPEPETEPEPEAEPEPEPEAEPEPEPEPEVEHEPEQPKAAPKRNRAASTTRKR
jgi:hypothetical protein